MHLSPEIDDCCLQFLLDLSVFFTPKSHKRRTNIDATEKCDTLFFSHFSIY